MTSMLHDTHRNNMYERAIQTMISSFVQTHHRAPVVLDIGTGTGLLAMMCARHGAGAAAGAAAVTAVVGQCSWI